MREPVDKIPENPDDFTAREVTELEDAYRTALHNILRRAMSHDKVSKAYIRDEITAAQRRISALAHRRKHARGMCQNHLNSEGTTDVSQS